MAVSCALAQMGLYIWPLSAVVHAVTAMQAGLHKALLARWSQPHLSHTDYIEITGMYSKAVSMAVPLLVGLVSYFGASFR